MSSLHAVSDVLVEQLVSDPAWRVLPDGTIETTRPTRSGRPRTWDVWHKATLGRYLHRRDGRVYRVSVRYKLKRIAVHRVVYRALIGPLDPGRVINHIDGNPENNHPSNLELVTTSANVAHAFRVLGRKPVYSRARLAPEDVRAIRLRFTEGHLQRDIAATFGVAQSNVSAIVTRKTWSNIE